MKLEQIAQVIAVANTGSFTKAAQQLYLSQPNLSQSIKQLEEEIGNNIFERAPSGVTVTPFGREYLDHLYSLQKELDSLDSFCQHHTQDIRLSLSIAVTKCIWINEHFSKVIASCSDHNLHFSLYNTEDLDMALDLVRSSACDLAVINLFSIERREEIRRCVKSGLEYHRFFSFPLHIMIGEKNSLYHQEGPITLEDMLAYPYVSYGSHRELTSSRLLRSLGISQHLQSTICVNTNSALYNVVANTQAFTLSANAFAYTVQPGIRAIPLPDLPYFIEYGWVKQQRMVLSSVAEDFIQSILDIPVR